MGEQSDQSITNRNPLGIRQHRASRRVRPFSFDGPSVPPEERPGEKPAPISVTRELLQAQCEICHAVDEPGILPREDWARVISHMRKIIPEMAGTEFFEEEMSAMRGRQRGGQRRRSGGGPPIPAERG